MNTNRRHIYIDGAAPNNQFGCKLGGLAIVILDEQDGVLDKLKHEKPTVVVKRVRGHSGIYDNELADTLAAEAATFKWLMEV